MLAQSLLQRLLLPNFISHFAIPRDDIRHCVHIDTHGVDFDFRDFETGPVNVEPPFGRWKLDPDREGNHHEVASGVD